MRADRFRSERTPPEKISLPVHPFGRGRPDSGFAVPQRDRRRDLRSGIEMVEAEDREPGRRTPTGANRRILREFASEGRAKRKLSGGGSKGRSHSSANRPGGNQNLNGKSIALRYSSCLRIRFGSGDFFFDERAQDSAFDLVQMNVHQVK